MGDTPSTSPEPLIGTPGGLGESFDVTGAMDSFDDWVLSFLKDEDNRELATDMLSQAGDAAKDCLSADAAIARDALRKSFDTIPKRLGLMARMLVNKTFGKFAPDIAKTVLGGDKILPATIDKEITRLGKEGGATIARNKNIIYPVTDGFIGKLQMLSLLSSFTGIENNEQMFRVVMGSTLVVPKRGSPEGPGMLSLNLISQLRYALESLNPPVHLKTKTVTEAAQNKPGTDEIFVVEEDDMVPTDLTAYKALFTRGEVQWYAPKIAASVLVSEGAPPVDALAAIGFLPFSDGYDTFKTQLETIGATPTAAPTLPRGADQKLDRTKLEEFKKDYDAGNKDAYTPQEKAAILVIGGTDVERALRASGILTTDPSYAALKADLDTLKQ